MVVKCENRTNKQLILRKGWGIFIAAILIFSTVALLADIQPTEAASGSYSEDFTTTTYIDSANTNVASWGSGNINLPLNMTLADSYNTSGKARGIFV